MPETMTNAEFDKWTAKWCGLQLTGFMPAAALTNKYDISFFKYVSGEEVWDALWNPSSPDAPFWQMHILERRIWETSRELYANYRKRIDGLDMPRDTSVRVAAMIAMKDEIDEASNDKT